MDLFSDRSPLSVAVRLAPLVAAARELEAEPEKAVVGWQAGGMLVLDLLVPEKQAQEGCRQAKGNRAQAAEQPAPEIRVTEEWESSRAQKAEAENPEPASGAAAEELLEMEPASDLVMDREFHFQRPARRVDR